jgi:hypothetical protein
MLQIQAFVSVSYVSRMLQVFHLDVALFVRTLKCFQGVFDCFWRVFSSVLAISDVCCWCCNVAMGLTCRSYLLQLLGRCWAGVDVHMRNRAGVWVVLCAIWRRGWCWGSVGPLLERRRAGTDHRVRNQTQAWGPHGGVRENRWCGHHFSCMLGVDRR